MVQQYTVKEGDSLSKIGQQYGVDYNKITGYSSGNPNIIRPGEILSIPVENLQNNTPIAQIPQTPSPNKDYNAEIAQLQAMADSLNTQKDTGDNIKAIFEKYIGDTKQAPSGVDEYTNFYGKTPQQIVQEEQVASDEYKRLSQELGNITKGSQIAQQQLESAAAGKDVTTTFLGREQQEVNRQAVIKGLPIAAQLEVAQGNLIGAQKKLDTLFTLKLKDAENDYNYKTKLLDVTYQFMTDDEKRRADAKKEADTRVYNDRVNNLNQAQVWATTAISNGQGALATQIMALDPNDADYQTKLGQLAGQIKAKPTTAPANTTFTSGGITIPESAIVQGQQTLDASRGNDYTNEKGETITPTGVDAQYVNSKLYLQMLQAWKDDKMDATDFFTKFPPKDYLNPNDSSIPKYIKDKLKAVESREL